MNELKTIRFSIINLRKFEDIVKTPREIEIPDKANIIDLILELDKLYFSKLANENEIRSEGFHDDFIKSLLQLMWNSHDLRFYQDVGIGARSPAPEYRFLPVLKDWRLILPNGTNLLITPLGET